MAQNDPSNSTDTTSTVDALSTQDEFAPERTFCPFESFDYDADEDAYRVSFDPDTVAPSTAVVSALAAISDTDPVEIEPLYAAVDPDALDTIAAKQPSTGDVEIAFRLNDYSILARSSGSLEVTAS